MQRSDINRLVAKRIRDRRNELGMSQEKLAGHVGVSHDSISRYESGICDFPLAVTLLIAECLRIPFVDLIPEELLTCILGENATDIKNIVNGELQEAGSVIECKILKILRKNS